MRREEGAAVTHFRSALLDVLEPSAPQFLAHLQREKLMSQADRELVENSRQFSLDRIISVIDMLIQRDNGWRGLITFLSHHNKDLVEKLEAKAAQFAAQPEQSAAQGVPVPVGKGAAVGETSLYSDANVGDSQKLALGKYAVNSMPKGLALIINNLNFKNPKKKRVGSGIDFQRSVNLWANLGYEVVPLSDLKGWQMCAEVEKFASNQRHKEFDSAVVVVMSHGSLGVLEGVDERVVDIHELVGRLNAKNCPNLRNKPKLILIQACRGGQLDGGVESDGPGEIGTEDIRQTFSWMAEEQYECDGPDKIPTWADILVGFATTAGYAAWRPRDTGSWYIQEICDVFEQCHTDIHVADMLTMVARNISEKTRAANEYKQISDVCMKLRHGFFI